MCPAASSTCPGDTWQDCGLCVKGCLHLGLWLTAPHGALLMLLFPGQCPRAGHTNHGSVGAERVADTNSTAVLGWTPQHIIKLLHKLMEINFILCHLCFSRDNKAFQDVCHVLRLNWLTAPFLTFLFPVYWGHWLLLGMSSGFCLTNFLLLWGPEQGQQFPECSYSVVPGLGILAASLNLADVCWELFYAAMFGDLQSSTVIMKIY